MTPVVRRDACKGPLHLGNRDVGAVRRHQPPRSDLYQSRPLRRGHRAPTRRCRSSGPAAFRARCAPCRRRVSWIRGARSARIPPERRRPAVRRRLPPVSTIPARPRLVGFTTTGPGSARTARTPRVPGWPRPRRSGAIRRTDPGRHRPPRHRAGADRIMGGILNDTEPTAIEAGASAMHLDRRTMRRRALPAARAGAQWPPRHV